MSFLGKCQTCGDRVRFWLASALDRRRRPRILLLADERGAPFDSCARQLRLHLKGDCVCDIRYARDCPSITASKYDLLYVFFWGETFHQRFGFDIERTIKEVSSHRWEDNPEYGPCTPAEMAYRHLWDAGSVICTSRRLYELIQPQHPRVFHAANGFDLQRYRMERRRAGAMVVGWAGNIKDTVKGVEDVLKPACEGRFKLVVAPGSLPHGKMNAFYNQIDICAVTSRHEGTPLPLLESMAAGCFPVCTDVGVVGELIRDGQNGIIVKRRSAEAFRAAFAWCEAHLDQVREVGRENARFIREERPWGKCAALFRQALVESLWQAARPRFRNDDVSPDTPLDQFRRFCGIFRRYGHGQVHGVLLRGRTFGVFKCGSEEAQYEGVQSISRIPNREIRALSERIRFEEREDLIRYLRQSSDEIALHGMYHTDYSTMSPREQLEEMTNGLELLAKIFPEKRVRYFIAPFNRTNGHTYEVARECRLQVLAAEGIQLEEHLHDLRIKPDTWYRYHHHRFYPESTFGHYQLSLEALDAALARSAEQVPHQPGRSEPGGVGSRSRGGCWLHSA